MEGHHLAESEPRGCVSAILRLFGMGVASERVADAALPYCRKDYLFSRAEASFFGVLKHVVDGRYLIFAKVRMADLLYLPKGTQARQGALNKIQSKHVDFLLCSIDGIRPLLAIELDDSSHDAPHRVLRDAFVVKAFSDAGLPLIQVRARASYNASEIAERIQSAISPTR